MRVSSAEADWVLGTSCRFDGKLLLTMSQLGFPPLNALALPALMLGEVGCFAYCTMSGTAVDNSCLRSDTVTGLATGSRLEPASLQRPLQARGPVCEKMQAKGLNDHGKSLPSVGRSTCGAKTRSGGACAHKVIAGRTRCRYHGGKSTDLRTAEGRARIAEAQRKRWAMCLRYEGDE